MQLLSICIPVYNEEKNVENKYEVIKKNLEEKLENFDYEIIFFGLGSIAKILGISKNLKAIYTYR